MSARHAYTDCRFGQLHYLESRPRERRGETAPALVLLHQNPSSSEEYRALVVEMGTDRQVIAFDTPGSGMSDRPSGPLPIDQLSAAFADGLDALGFGAAANVDVFGYHTGTLLAVELALSRPDLVRRVVLTGIPFRSAEECRQRLDAARRTPPLTGDGGSVLERFAALWRYVVTERDPGMPLDTAAALFMEKAKPMHRSWWPYEGVWRYPVADRLPLLSQSVLVLQPWEELLEPSRRAAQLIPHSRLVELPGLSRDVFDVGTHEIATELRRFLPQEP